MMGSVGAVDKQGDLAEQGGRHHVKVALSSLTCSTLSKFISDGDSLAEVGHVEMELCVLEREKRWIYQRGLGMHDLVFYRRLQGKSRR